MKKFSVTQLRAKVCAAIMILTFGVSSFASVPEKRVVKAATTEESDSTSENTSEVLKSWDFTDGTQDWYYGSGWEYQYDGAANSSVEADEGKLKVNLDYSANSDVDWSQMAVCSWDSTGYSLDGADSIALEFYYDSSSMTQGNFTIKAYSNAGIDVSVPVDQSQASTVEDTIQKVSVTLSMDTLSGADTVNDFSICLVGVGTDYVGSIWLDEITISASTSAEEVEEDEEDTTQIIKSWDFDDGIDGWYYGSGWEYQYDGASNSAVDAEDGKLKVTVDYSANSTQSWSQLAVCYWDDAGFSVSGVNQVTLDFYYDSSCMTTGSFMVKLVSNGGIDQTATISFSKAETVDGSIKKVTVTSDFDTLTADSVNDFAICLVGVTTDYVGSIWLDNVELLATQQSAASDIYVNSTIQAVSGSAVTCSQGTIQTKDANDQDEVTEVTDEISIVDPDAVTSVKQTYAYMKAIGESDSVVFGHQDDTFQKAGSSSLSSSDTYDMTGSIAGVVGIDALAMTGAEYSASRYNSDIANQEGLEELPETAAGNVQAAAAITNRAIEEGAIVTLSAHMPNFSLVQAQTTEDTLHTYAAYDFSGYTPNDLSGDVMNQILPGGTYNEVFTAYLDMIADYASQVDGTILFRPFHEGTGSWFWWGSDSCEAETFKSVYRYTVEYLRDIKGVHNFLYVYGPSCDATSTEEYGERYPGDAYVDIVGFDMYHSNPTADDTWFDSFATELNVVQQFATEHGKLLVVSETGVSSTTDEGDSQTALHKTGNEQQDWYNTMLEAVSGSNASYFLLWANFSETSGFYTPYVKSVNEDGTLYGHEMLDNFIDFYNDPRSIFAVDQKEVLEDGSSLSEVTADLAIAPIDDNETGYFCQPVSGSRVLDAMTVIASVTGISDTSEVTFVMNGADEQQVVLVAANTAGSIYEASMTAEELALLGSTTGTMELCVDQTVLQTISVIYNIADYTEQTEVVDDFEQYYGLDSLMLERWDTNQESDSSVTVGLAQPEGMEADSTYAMEFVYDESADGWAGTTTDKEVDWSAYNALQLWTIPDGNNQKTVVQITANDTTYEVYLNLYEDYQNATEPVLVTIPFATFLSRDEAGNPTGGLSEDCSNVTSVGLWVNAIDGSDAVVDGRVTGTIYYDEIEAVTTDVEQVTIESASESSSGSSSGSSSESQTDSSSSSTESSSATESGVTISVQEDGSLLVTVLSTSSWKAIEAKIASASAVTLQLQDTTIVPASFFQAVKGKDQSIQIELANGVQWSFCGTDITEDACTKMDLGVDLNKNAISQDRIDALLQRLPEEGEADVQQVSFQHSGSFGFTADLVIPVEVEDAGSVASLYSIQESDGNAEFQNAEFQNASVITNQTIGFEVENALDYLIVYGDAPLIDEKTYELIQVNLSKQTLALSGEKTKTTVIQIELPENLEKLCEENLLSMKVTYTTSDKSVAMVSRAGKVYAKKAGKAAITTTVTMNGMAYTYITKITVKKTSK